MYVSAISMLCNVACRRLMYRNKCTHLNGTKSSILCIRNRCTIYVCVYVLYEYTNIYFILSIEQTLENSTQLTPTIGPQLCMHTFTYIHMYVFICIARYKRTFNFYINKRFFSTRKLCQNSKEINTLKNMIFTRTRSQAAIQRLTKIL